MKSPITLVTGKKVDFVWGKVIAIHSIGDITIVESQYNDDSVSFHPYVGDKDARHSYLTLDKAIVGALEYKYDGLNSQAAYFFIRMIDM